MNREYRLSNVTKKYLAAFDCILDEMMRGMTEAELNESISHNFIVQMIPHHRAAIQMSRNILEYTTNVPLQDIAAQIITEQTRSIENMKQILCSCETICNSQRDLCLYQRRVNQILQTMFAGMENAKSTNQINCDFMWEMIPHHLGAISMSKNALGFDICPGLKPILRAIISSQERGVQQMRQLQRCIGC